jgi:hypothetical protein
MDKAKRLDTVHKTHTSPVSKTQSISSKEVNIGNGQDREEKQMDEWMPEELRVTELSRIDALAEMCWVPKLGGEYFDYDKFARLIIVDGRSTGDNQILE